MMPVIKPETWQERAERLMAIRDKYGEPADLAAEVERLREALEKIADGRWNVGAPRNLNVREFAREAVRHAG